MENIPEGDYRQQAMVALKKKRDLQGHIVIYLLVNASLVGIWAVSTRPGFFWPIFVILGWGIGLVMNIWDVYRQPPTEADIQREAQRLRSKTRLPA